MKEKRYIPVKFETLALDETKGTFSGYATTFGSGSAYTVWQGVDETFKRGAFSKTLQENGGKVPILHNHDPNLQIGWGLTAVEESKGLLVTAWLDIENNAQARADFSLIKKGLEIKSKPSMSLGFSALDAITKKRKDKNDLRTITEARLWEYSPTPFPANPKANMTQVRSIQDYLDSVDKLSIEERSLLMTRLNELLKADPPQEPKESLHSILESLQSANSTLNRG